MENRNKSGRTSHHPKGGRLASRSKIIGYYSIDADRNFVPGSSNLRYFNPPDDNPVTLDLDDGREKAEDCFDFFQNPSMSRTIQWIMANQEKVKMSCGSERLIRPHFVCNLRLLTCFMTAPYTPNECWNMWAGKWKGTIYLRMDKSSRSPPDEEAIKFGYWGHKFQQYVTSESPDKAPNTDKLAPEKEEFRCVYQHQFEKFSVLFTAVRKACLSKEKLSDPVPLHKLKFTDLRTNRIIEHAGHDKTVKKYKFLQWWAKAYLTNDDQIFCGFRDNNGVVIHLKTFKTDEMVRMARWYWNPSACIECCNTMLAKLAETVVDDCDETIYQLCRKSHEEFDIKELKPSEENRILPDWYKNGMNN